jgi:hypothetical protein
MMVRLTQLLLAHPRLVGAHALAYGDLALLDLQCAARQWLRQALLVAVGLCAACIGAVLAGTAWMLWAAGLPFSGGPLGVPWPYVLAPGAAWLVALGCAFAVWRIGQPQALRRVRSEWARDRRWLDGPAAGPDAAP